MIPTTRERKALQNIRDGDWHHLGDLHGAGDQTRREMNEKGWIELGPHPIAGWPSVRITADGKAALAKPIPPKAPSKRARIPLLKSRIPVFDARRVKPSKS